MNVDIIKTSDSVAFVRDHPDIYFGIDHRPTVDLLITSVTSDAVILGVDLIVIERTVRACFVFGNKNWMRIGRKEGESYIDIFNKIHQFPQAGQNSIRSEILVTAFSSDVVAIEGERVHRIKGERSDSFLLDGITMKLKYGIGFIISTPISL
jgi:hypothetical protein